MLASSGSSGSRARGCITLPLSSRGPRVSVSYKDALGELGPTLVHGLNVEILALIPSAKILF